MRNVILASMVAVCLQLLGTPPAKAEFTQIQRIALMVEILRLRADYCRTTWGTFKPADLSAMTEASAALLQIAKFDTEQLVRVVKGLSLHIKPNHSKADCANLYRFVFEQ